MALTHPTGIPGRWREGFALDYHTIKSDFIGHDEYGHPRFETVRTEQVSSIILILRRRGSEGSTRQVEVGPHVHRE